MQRELSKAEIKSLLADVFISHTLLNDINFKIDGKYKLNLTFIVNDDHLEMTHGAIYKVEES